jgi:hypothetical protein
LQHELRSEINKADFQARILDDFVLDREEVVGAKK